MTQYFGNRSGSSQIRPRSRRGSAASSVSSVGGALQTTTSNGSHSAVYESGQNGELFEYPCVFFKGR